MASSFTSTKETTNYARLCRLLVDVGSQVLRDKFDRIHPPGSLHTVLTGLPVNATLTSLKKKRVLFLEQWIKLTSPTVSSADFDITLLVVLLRNICSLSPPVTGWNSPPALTDTTEAADIVRLKIHRNQVYAHTNRASVDDATFSKYWDDIKDPLVRLGGSSYQATIDDLKTVCMDPENEQLYQERLKEWKENEECVMEKLEEIEGKVDAIESIVQTVDGKLDFLMPPVAHPVYVYDVNVEDFSARLCALYNNLSQVKITPWDPDNTVDIDEIYTQLYWLRDDKRPRGTKQEKLADYSDILNGRKSNANPNRILVYGRPGIGKSTFAQKIAIDWARGIKENLKKFDLLLMIQLRNVCDSETFHDMLIDATLFSADNQGLIDSLHSYILQHKDKVLLVLDGFDEYSTGRSSPVFDIWTGSELRECFVILTTRPIKQDEVKRFSHVQFQIKGFDSAQIREFSMKFLDDKQEVEMFLVYIKKHKLEEIAEIPLLLLMLCLVWKERDREGLPESKVFLYSGFIQALCNHLATKDDDGTVNSIESYNADLAQVGELAFRALLENSLEFDFEHLPNELLSSKLIRVGVIQIVKIFSARPKKVVSFLHKSIQEFLAAWFIIHELIPNAKDNLSCMHAIDSTEKVVAMVEVLKFVSGWSPEGSSAVLQHLESLKKKHSPSEHHISEIPFLEDWPEDDKKLLELNLECFIETPASAKADVYPSLLNSVSGVLIVPDTMLHLVADDHVVKSKVLPNYVLFDFRRSPSQKERDYIASIMEDLKAVIVIASGERKASDFVNNLSEFEVLSSLFLKREGDKMYLHFSQIANIDVGTLDELTLPPPSVPPQTSQSHDHLQGDEITPEANWPTRQHCFSLAKKIDINEMDDEHVGVISKVMPLVGRPEEITIHSSQEPSQSQEIERLVEGMNITECLQRLRLHKIILTAQSLAVVTRAFHQAANLQELFLSENPLGSSVSLLVENLQHMQQLTTLELSGVRMEEQAFSDLSYSLCHVPQLKVLSVSRNNLGPSITALADNLDSLPCLTHLELSETQMDEEGATALFKCLRSLSDSKLEVLDVSHNPLGSAVIVIAEHLDGAPCLTVLNMTDVKMGDHEVTALASSLKNLQNLWFLSVGANPLGRGVCALVKNLSKIPRLKRLDLTSVQMGDEEINSVSKACKITQRFTITTDYHDVKGKPRPVKVVVNASRARYYGFDDQEDDFYDDRNDFPDYNDDNDDYYDNEQDYGVNDEDYGFDDDRDNYPDYDNGEDQIYEEQDYGANDEEVCFDYDRDNCLDYDNDENQIYEEQDYSANDEEVGFDYDRDNYPDYGNDEDQIYEEHDYGDDTYEDDIL